MRYRVELEALNAIVVELRQMNEHLQKLTNGDHVNSNNLRENTTVQPTQPMIHTPKRQYTRRANNDVS